MILIPSLRDIETSSTSSAETRIARLLQQVEGPRDAVAFHSVKLRSHSVKQQSEADFVVLWNGVVIVLEVKGGGVRKHEGAWYSIDRRGDWHKLRESPMQQAQTAVFALRDILDEEKVGWFAYEAVVVTPDIDAPPASVEWKSSHWWAKDTMNLPGLAQAIDSVAKGTRQASTRRKIASADALRTRLFGEFTRLPAIDAQRGAVIEEQNRATDGQAQVLAALAMNPRMLVFGGAGTGKSLILAEAAKQEVGDGNTVLITYRSPALARFFRPLVKDWGIDVLAFDDLVEGKQYDVVFVDETQDLMNAEGMDALDQVIHGGRAEGRWRMFLDPNNQAYVDGEFDREVCDLIKTEATQLHLKKNVRNTRAIVHVVQEYLGADVGDPGIVNGEKVYWHNVDGEADIVAAERIAGELVRDGARRNDVWVIDASSDAGARLGDAKFVVTSPRYAKGLETEYVVVCGLPKHLDDRGIAAFYVAVTRARVTLHIVVSADDKKRLEDLLRKAGK